MTNGAPSTPLLDAIETGIAARPADVLLLSGGVDSSLLAAVATELGQAPVAITVTLATGPANACPAHGPDLAVPCNSDHEAAQRVASWLGLNWQPIHLPPREAIDALLFDQVANWGTERLYEQAPLATYVALVPFVGVEEACAIANRSR